MWFCGVNMVPMAAWHGDNGGYRWQLVTTSGNFESYNLKELHIF